MTTDRSLCLRTLLRGATNRTRLDRLPADMAAHDIASPAVFIIGRTVHDALAPGVVQASAAPGA
jgi:hypothetical protein